jgi:chromosome segregation ATPase|tara:strand:+ start:6819 stop:7316 length:498 start_codon:yes stop_codon:yes gene_type:complete
MAEVEIGGISFKGGKMLSVMLALTTAVGALYGGFEVYKDYMDMKEQISEYVAPDLSAINLQIAVLEETVESQNGTIESYDTRLKGFDATISGLSTEIDSFQTTSTVARESINRIDGDLQGLFSDVRGADKRVYELERDTSRELTEIRKSIATSIEEALANPLSGQ